MAAQLFKSCCVLSRLRRLATAGAMLAAALAAGCSALPGSGPSAENIVQDASAEQPRFTLIDLTPPVVDVLRTRALPSFRGSFGMTRARSSQVIGVGDAISVTIWEAAAGGLFSAPAVDRLGPGSRSAVIPEQIVAADGSITVPYAGRLRVAGLLPHAVELKIIDLLKNKAIEPQALVTITRNASNTVSVTGEVVAGAVVPLNVRGQTLMEVISQAGGVRGAAHETSIVLTRGGRSVQVPLQRIIATPSENITVRGGDVITLVRAPITFTAVGATGQNAVIPFGQVNLTLEEAIARAGGLLDWRADPEGTFILRYEPVALVRRMLGDPTSLPGEIGLVPVVYRANLRDANSLFLARSFPILDKDILFVANAKLSEVQKMFSLINTLVSPANAVREATR